MFAKVISLALCIAVAGATEGWTNCATESDVEITRLDVEGCENTPCVFIKGNSYDIEVHAVSDRVTNSLPYTISILFGGVDFPFASGEACDFLILGNCPTTVGGEFGFRNALEVTNNLPDLSSTATARVNDDAGNEAICVHFDIITQSP